METGSRDYIDNVIRSIDERIAEAEAIIKFLKAQKATALEQRDGRRLPQLQYYFVRSRTSGEGHYIKREAVTDKWSCTCPAGRRGVDCWALRGVRNIANSRGELTVGWFYDDNLLRYEIGYSESSWYDAQKKVNKR